MIPWFEPVMTGGEADAVKAVLESGYLNDGPVTRKFEQEVAAISGRTVRGCRLQWNIRHSIVADGLRYSSRQLM